MWIAALVPANHTGLAALELESALEAEGVACEAEVLHPKLVRARVAGSPDEVVRAARRTAYTKEVIAEKSLVPARSIGELLDWVGSSDWAEVEGRTFAVEVTKLGAEGYPPSPEVAAMVGSAILGRAPGARVDLAGPGVRVRVLILRGFCIVGFSLLRLGRSRFRPRSPERRPFFHPCALTPDLSRALVNLGRIGPGARLLDPFCGSGSVLIESALLGVYSVGMDINCRLVKGAALNLGHYGLRHMVDLVVTDSAMMPIRDGAVDAVVTDPPYGRISAGMGLRARSLYESFLGEAARVVREGSRVVYMYAKGRDPPGHPGLPVKDKFEIYVHGNLTRVVAVAVRDT